MILILWEFAYRHRAFHKSLKRISIAIPNSKSSFNLKFYNIFEDYRDKNNDLNKVKLANEKGFIDAHII